MLQRLPRPPRQLRLGAHLVIVVLAALVPVVLFAIAMIGLFVRQERAALEHGMVHSARALSLVVDTELQRTISALGVLALSDHLTRGDLAAFHREAEGVRGTEPMWTNVILAGPSGAHLVNVRRPFGTALPPLARVDAIVETASSRKPTITGHTISAILQRPVVVVAVPVIRDGDVRYVVEAVIESTSWHDIVGRHTPTPSFGAIVDRQGLFIARARDPERFVGASVSPSMRAATMAAAEGSVKGQTVDGITAYGFFHTSPLSGWSVVLTVPASTIDLPVQRTLALAVGGFAAFLLIGGAMAFVVGRGIGRSIGRLGRSARALGSGEPLGTARSRIAEVAWATAALHAASALLDERQSREQAARAELEAASRAKDQFIAMLGHELRNPLGAIWSAVGVLDRLGSPEDRAVRAREIMARQLRHVKRLVDDLLDVGRMTTGKIALVRQPVDVAGIVSAFIATSRAAGMLDRHDVSFTGEPVWVDGDATRIEQMTANLVLNALKYTPPAGHVRVRVTPRDGDAVITVEDDGAGIPTELLPKVFDLFVQGEQGPDREGGGLGIGLTLVRRLTQLHGGTVEAASDGPGRGARFTIRLPAIAPPVRAGDAWGGAHAGDSVVLDRVRGANHHDPALAEVGTPGTPPDVRSDRGP